jgi:hypothetical protein
MHALMHTLWNIFAVIGIIAVVAVVAFVGLNVAADRGWIGPT